MRQATEFWPNKLLIPIGYSQGAICASPFWRDWAIVNNQQSRIVAVLAWGNPCRSRGHAKGNAYAGWGMPGERDGVVTGGISGPDCLLPSQTPSNWLDFVWLGSGATELYTNAPVGLNPWTAEAPAGLDETSRNVTVQLGYCPDWYWSSVGGGDNGEGWLPYGNATPACWQFTDAALIGPWSVDCNAFKGTPAQLAAAFGQ